MTLHVTLLKMINLAGLQSDVPTLGIMHERFVGASGELYVACDERARFWPREVQYDDGSDDSLGYRCNIGTFVSRGVGRQFQDFILTEKSIWTRYLHGLNIRSEKADILQTINSRPELRLFFQRFFEWVTEFAQKHGEARYVDRETYWRNVYKRTT